MAWHCDLRRFVFFADRGAAFSAHRDDQCAQAHYQTLVVYACVLSTTGCLDVAIAVDVAEGHDVSGEAKAHLSISHFEAKTPTGGWSSTSPVSSTAPGDRFAALETR